MLLEFLFRVFRDRVLLGNAFRHLPVEFGEFAVFLLQQFLDEQHPVSRQFAKADLGVGWQIRIILPDALGQRWAQFVDADEIALAVFATADVRGHLLGGAGPGDQVGIGGVLVATVAGVIIHER